MAIFLALLAAVSYGTGDFVGGLGGRRSDAALMPVAVQTVGVLVALGASLVQGAAPTPHALWWGLVSGVGSGIGNICLLRGLAAGRMSVVAPLSAVLTAALPALFGLVTGDRLAWWGWIGIVLAFPAVALASRADSADGFRWADVGFGLGAGAGFGLLFVALDRAGTGSGGWPLVPGQLLALVIATTLAVRRLPRINLAVVRWGAACGLLGGAANLMFLFSTGLGQLTISAVLAGLYPTVTVALAAVVLHERINRDQRAGLLAAAASIVLIITGS